MKCTFFPHKDNTKQRTLLMKINKKHIENIFLQRFSLKDQKELSKYFENSQLNEDAQKIVKEQWQHFQPDTEKQTDHDHIFYKLYYNINQGKINSTKRNLAYWIPRAAAVFMIGLFVAASIYFYKKELFFSQSQQVVVSSQIEFVSQSGFRNQFRLPDGTSGWLGYNSKLKYNIDENNQRTVSLDGLAFFDVSHNDNLPFIVKTPSKLEVKVLGTRFNISSYSEENSCEVILEEGNVNLQLNNKDIEKMIPGERILFNSIDKTINKSIVEVSDYVAWKEGLLVLNGVSLDEACTKISRFYNVEVDLQISSLNGRQVRLVLEDESLEEALNLLCLIFPVKYHIQSGKILDNNSYSKKEVIIKK